MSWNVNFHKGLKNRLSEIIQPAETSAINGQKFPSIGGQCKAALTVDVSNRLIILEKNVKEILAENFRIILIAMA